MTIIQTLLRALLFLTLLVGLPLLGVMLAGHPAAQYLEFPPQTRYVEHAGFSWPVFLALAALVAGVVLPFVRCVIIYPRRFGSILVGLDLPDKDYRGERTCVSSRSPGGEQARALHKTSPDEPQNGSTRTAPRHESFPSTSILSRPFPWWGWLGLLFGAGAWVLAWCPIDSLDSIRRFTFSPLWFAYIAVVNALVWKRTGRCMLTDQTGYFLALFPVSAGFWWFFEYLNRFVQNWYYLGVGMLTPLEYVLFATLPFSTVLPAVMGTYDLLATAPRLRAGLDGFRPLRPRHPRLLAGVALALFACGLAGIGLWPDYLFPLLWLAPLGILLALNTLAGQPTLLADLARGDWRRIVLLALAALVCGVFWEMWNYGSLAKWVYAVPYVNRFHLFEMPLLGYAGYLPFGLECAVIADAVGAAIRRRRID